MTSRTTLQPLCPMSFLFSLHHACTSCFPPTCMFSQHNLPLADTVSTHHSALFFPFNANTVDAKCFTMSLPPRAQPHQYHSRNLLPKRNQLHYFLQKVIPSHLFDKRLWSPFSLQKLCWFPLKKRTTTPLTTLCTHTVHKRKLVCDSLPGMTKTITFVAGSHHY